MEKEETQPGFSGDRSGKGYVLRDLHDAPSISRSIMRELEAITAMATLEIGTAYQMPNGKKFLDLSHIRQYRTC